MNSSTIMNPDFIWKIFEKLRRPVGLFLLLVLTSILQHIFDLHFVCSCRPGLHANDILYMILPSLILTLAVYVVKIFYKKRFFLTVDRCICKSYNTYCNWTYKCCCTCKWTCFFIWRFLEFLSLTALWIAMVLFDGDWFFCVMTNQNSDQTGLPCKKILKYEEERIKDSYKTDSLDWGLGVCFCLLLFWIIVESFREQLRSYFKWHEHPYYEAKYQNILSEELSSFIEEELKEIAKTKAKQMCELKIEKIRNHVLPQNNRSEDGVSKTWENISDPSFIFEYQEMAECNPTTNTETENRTSAAEGSVAEGQHGQPRTASGERPSEDLADCPDPVEERSQPGVESGESVGRV